MTPDEVNALATGIYRVEWRHGHETIGVIGPPRDAPHIRTLVATDGGSAGHINPWPLVESVERLTICETAAQCQIRREMFERTKPAAIALVQSMSADAAVIARDSFLAGDDAGALAIISHELGLVQLASPRPVWRDLKVGDPVVVVSYGRITDRLEGHGITYEVGLFSEGVRALDGGYSNSTRLAWFEPDEIRYSLPPEHIIGRVGAGDRKSLDSVQRDRPKALLDTSSPWKALTVDERLTLIKQCCATCGAMIASGRRCSCARDASALAPYSKDPGH